MLLLLSLSSSSIPLRVLLLFRSRARSPTPSERSFFDVSSSSKSDEFHSGALSATPTRCRRDYFATSLMTSSSSSSSSSSLQQTPGAATSSSCLFCRDGARCRYLLLIKTFPIRVTTKKKPLKNNLGSQNPKPNPKHIGESVGELKRKKRTLHETHTSGFDPPVRSRGSTTRRNWATPLLLLLLLLEF